MFSVIDRTYQLLKNQEVDGFDIYCVKKTGFSVDVKDGKIEKTRTSNICGVAIRVLVSGRLGFSYTTETSDEGLRIAVECAMENAKISSPDEYVFSSPASTTYTLTFSEDKNTYLNIDKEKKIEKALIVDEVAREQTSKVKKVRKISYSDSLLEVFYANSLGNSFNYSTASYSLYAYVVAEDLGESQSGWDIQTTRYFNRLLPELVAKESVENAVALLGAKPIRTRRIPVIFKNVVFAELLSAMIPAFLGDSVVKKKSMFADKLGYEIASHVVNIYDDPTSSEGTGSVPFDDEGTPTRKKALIERGVLRTFLTDLFYALKLQVEPTGNGIRSGISSPPKPGITNLVLERGALDLKELVQTPEEVILITDAMGLHTVNPVSGEFSVGISGLFYKDGKLVQPISGMTVAGNLRELLLGINQVGKDVKWLYNVASPSVLVKSLTVSGI